MAELSFEAMREALRGGSLPRVEVVRYEGYYPTPPKLAERLLDAAGYPRAVVGVIADDFQHVAGKLEPFDLVAMNPPFERLQDCSHVLAALDRLAPGGRLAAIMSPGWTFRACRRTREFKAALDGIEARAMLACLTPR